jgi:hypothetical protein
MHTDIHTFSGIRTQDPSFRADEVSNGVTGIVKIVGVICNFYLWPYKKFPMKVIFVL